MKKVKVNIGDLKFGMYVSDLDRPWTDTPFVFQGFVLKDDEQLQTLKKFCQWVMVDADLSEAGAAPLAVGATPLTGTGKVQHAEKVAVEHELARARDAYFSSEAALTKAFESVGADQAFDADSIKGAVTNMSQSVMRNPDALVLVSAMKERGNEVLDRAMKVSLHMIMFSRFMGMEQTNIERAGLVGLLQDIGMVKLPPAIIARKGPLSDPERVLVKTHLEHTLKMLSETPGIGEEVAQLAVLHHERHDGSGYPRGLKGEAIPTIGAIAGLIDTFCALTATRPYADPLAPSRALGMMHKWRGQTFHPTLVEEFIRCIGVFPVGSVVALNSGEVGVVIAQNTVKRLQPRIMVVRDANGNQLRPQKLLDLARSPKVSADETYRILRTLEYGQAGVGMKDLFL
jgi:HD-GYP domain-containing protein (c-di-GMP phosphodiesterase class II)